MTHVAIGLFSSQLVGGSRELDSRTNRREEKIIVEDLKLEAGTELCAFEMG